MKDAVKTDPTAVARSSIRRRPSIHSRRTTRTRLTRDSTIPRFEHSPPPQTPGLDPSGRSTATTGVPPISTLLATTDWQNGAPPPAPVPESRNYYEYVPAQDNGERHVRREVLLMEAPADRSQRMSQNIREIRERPLVGSMYAGAISRSPEPLPQPQRMSQRPQSRSGMPAHHGTLPTPPADTSDTDPESLFLPEARFRARGSHPLRHSWNPGSPVDGLGDRNRSPTPADGWEVMRSTITPDATLPSADSSFTSAAASHSFTSNHDTNANEPGRLSASQSSRGSRHSSSHDGESDSASSVDPDDLICDDDNARVAESFAEDMYDFEWSNRDGRDRIRAQEQDHAHTGDRFALPNESDRVEIGFRLIEDALDTEEGRERLLQIGVLDGPNDIGPFEDVVQMRRSRYHAPRGSQMHHTSHIRSLRRRQRMNGPFSPPPPPPRGDADRPVVREARAQVHNYFRRFTADALRSRSPPPHEPLGSHPDVTSFTSRDPPVPHPVSPPSHRRYNEVVDTLLSGDETDLGTMRRVVERLARRDDVPDEWWTSIGLNLSRTRPLALSTRRNERRADEAAGDRVRAGRIERANSRL